MSELDLRQQYLIRRGSLFTERESWIPQYREISQFMMPRTGRFLMTDRNKGAKRHNSILDSTGTRALRVLAAGLMAGMTSPARPWFRLATGDKKLMDRANVKRWLNDVTETMRTVFARSNTYRALHMMYEELGGYGTAASIVMDDFQDVLRHYPSTVGEYMIATDHRGEVTTLYREFEMTVAAIVGEFGIDNVSPGVRNMWTGGRNLDAWVPVLHVIEPRKDRDTTSRLPRDMPYASCYLELQSNEKGKFLRESGFKRFPALCPRWAATGGDIYGNSPGMESLGDVKQLQHGQLRKAQGIDYKIRPPIQVPAAMKNMPLSTLPGGAIYVDQATPHGGIRSAWDVNIDINAQIEDIRDVRQRINETFYVDLFLMLANADNREPITAREVAEKHEEKLLMLGPVLERLHNEMLKPYIDITFDRMIEAHMVPRPPDELNGMDLNVEFVSMLAQAQRAIGVGSVDRLVNTIGQIAVLQAKSGVHPDILDKLNTDEVVDQYADMLGVDPNLIVADEQVAIVRQNRAKQQQAAQQAATMQAGASAVKDVAQAGPAGEQAAADIISQFSGYGGPGIAAAA